MRVHDPALHIEQIILAARNAMTFVVGLSEKDFLTDLRTQHAVAMSLIVIGENGKRLLRKCPEFVNAHAHVPWLEMTNMRDRIAHGYETVNFPIIWQTVRDDLPSLLQVLEPILAELDGAGSPGGL